MKTEQELQELQDEVKSMQNKLSELTEEELEKVCGGFDFKGLLDTIAPIVKPLIDQLYNNN